jgi:predicted ATP-dependent endonuclease of OLD family
MKLHSVELMNYRSIGVDHNEIIIEPNITAVIGKNESGKSNVLSGLSGILFRNKMTNVFAENNVNRNSDNGKIVYTITLKALPDEAQCLQEETTVTITPESYSAVGGIIRYYEENVKATVDAFYEIVNLNPFKFTGNDLTAFRQRCSQIKIEDSIDVPSTNAALNTFVQWAPRVPADQQAQYKSAMDSALTKWQELCNLFPVMFYRHNDRILQSEYKGDALKKELENTNSFLCEFVKYIGFTKEQILQAVSGRTDGSTSNLQDKIQRAIDAKINTPFESFYTVEKVTLKARFTTNILSFTVSTDSGSTMTLGERSDGLRWYLNLFIDVMANNLPSRQVVYLFDEPGISLHVNAQKELLKLFADLASKGNQIVYTTHSPYMLDTTNNGIERIRATVKDESGITKIYRTAYHPDIAPDAQEDTLTPIVRALGMSISDTFGPAYEKFNVVTEGISDCVYLLCIGKKLGIDLSKYAFIPVVGASNLINVCTILHGWGCNYLALFDYDSEGVTKGGEIFKNKYELEYKKHFMYLKDASEDEITSKTYKTDEVEIETLVTDLDACLTNKGHVKCGKVLNAKWYADALEDDTHTCSSETLKNFKELFDRINSSMCE